MEKDLVLSIYEGWQAYQETLGEAIGPLNNNQLRLRTSPKQRSVGEIAAHIVGTRARWFYQLMEEGGDEFKAFGKWDRRGAKVRSAEELVSGLQATWTGMHEAIARWRPGPPISRLNRPDSNSHTPRPRSH